MHSVLCPSGPGRHLGVSSLPQRTHDTAVSRFLFRFPLGGVAVRVFHRCSPSASNTLRSSPRIINMEGSISGFGSGRMVESSADGSAATATRHVLSGRTLSGLETTLLRRRGGAQAGVLTDRGDVGGKEGLDAGSKTESPSSSSSVMGGKPISGIERWFLVSPVFSAGGPAARLGNR